MDREQVLWMSKDTRNVEQERVVREHGVYEAMTLVTPVCSRRLVASFLRQYGMRVMPCAAKNALARCTSPMAVVAFSFRESFSVSR
ncbi:hypothetical protein EF847_06575 [Actinobacteria bacterium YIM 96077]|uniref:Uncharacterized protein n=1 Tax=Phytoactinopolyspora halophila TaxID=1981511 RepID=A0A329QJA6_9ACTN|nr:hypothetical protein EF847_06575 [Actinobacteria bacterium YIM 96077]RAW12001.1 hypothetical protein DPM12_15095 [Phytoactinopolyspora halophila]